MIPYELDLITNPFSNTTIITYEIDLIPSGNKIGLNLLGDEYFTILYVTDTIPNSLASHQLPTQAKRNLWIVVINREELITSQGALDELNLHQTPCGKYNIKISLCRRNIYQRTDTKDIRSMFYQVRPVFSLL